jgi:hypothetical protein
MTNLLRDQILLVLTATAGVIVLLVQLDAHRRLSEADPRLICQTHRGLYQKMQIVPMPIQAVLLVPSSLLWLPVLIVWAVTPFPLRPWWWPNCRPYAEIQQARR